MFRGSRDASDTHERLVERDTRVEPDRQLIEDKSGTSRRTIGTYRQLSYHPPPALLGLLSHAPLPYPVHVLAFGPSMSWRRNVQSNPHLWQSSRRFPGRVPFAA